MTPIQSLTDLLRSLPSGVRRGIYTTIVLLGALLAILDASGVTDLGPMTVAQALQVYAYISPIAGVVAVANVSKPAADTADYQGHGEDVDLSSFQPVGDVDEVYGQGAW
jgi:hypothetical protein